MKIILDGIIFKIMLHRLYLNKIEFKLVKSISYSDKFIVKTDVRDCENNIKFFMIFNRIFPTEVFKLKQMLFLIKNC